jgi:hypothetical protein
MSFSFLSKNKKEHIIELYNPSNSLPKKGWIQQCKNCDMRTSRTFEFKRVENKKTIFIYMVYLCKDCNKKSIITDKEFINNLNKHINLKYSVSS